MAIFVDDIGTIFQLEFRDYQRVDGVDTDVAALDISGASEITMLFKKPDGTVLTKTLGASEVTKPGGGTDGIAQYVAVTGFLDLHGVWRLEGYVELSGTAKHYSAIVMFEVEEHL